MSEQRTIRVLGVERPGQMYIWKYEERPPEPGHFRVQTLFTGLSAGTELTFFKGTNPYLESRWDAEYGVFREDSPSQSFPMPFLGYMEVGRVTQSRTPAVQEGQIVGMAYGHKTGHTAHAADDFWVPIPDDVDPILGIYAAQMGPICANGVLHAAADLFGGGVRELGEGVRGRNVLVTGAGVVGLLTGLFARLLGAAEVAIADRTPARLRAGEVLGMIPLDETEDEAWRWCKERWHHAPGDRGADVVFQCRGQTESLQTALRSLRPQASVIDLAFYQGGAPEVRLGEEFHHNGLSVRCAQIGRVPRGLGHLWNRQRLAAETVALLRETGAAVRAQLITEVVPFDEAPCVIEEIADRRRHSIQTVFEVAE